MSLWRKRQIQDKIQERLRGFVMSYREALEAAGAQVVVFEQFGDWQGSWVALVQYQGQRGWVQGSYGSCDHCDSFQAEFGWEDCEQEDYQWRLADFGRTYLDGLMSTAQLAEHFDESADWDMDSQLAAEFVRRAG